MASTPEGRVKAGIKKILKDHNVWFYMPVSNGMGVHGIPDFVCCVRGQFLGIEAKAPGRRGNTSALQDIQIAAIHKAGGRALVADDPQQVQEFLEKLEQEHELV